MSFYGLENDGVTELYLAGRNIGSAGAQQLAEALKVHKSLHTLDLRNNDIDSTGIRHLAEALQVNNSLHSLDLGLNNIGPTGAQHLAEALQVNKSLHTLKLEWTNIGSTGVFHLTKALKSNKTLHTLSLERNGIDSTGAQHFAEALKVNKSLHSLNLRGNEIGSTGARHLAEALAANDSLHSLDLGANGVGSTGTQYLAEALAANSSLRTLNLESNHIDIKDSGIQHLANALKVNTSLHILHLGWNNIDSTSTQHLSEALKINKTLHTLSLGENEIDSVGAHLLAEALKVNKSLHTLNLSENEIDSTGAQSLAEALKTNKSLHTLDLRNNDIDSKGAQYLAGALKSNNSLHTLDLEFNDIDSTGVERLADALKVNKSICILSLERCEFNSSLYTTIFDRLLRNQQVQEMNPSNDKDRNSIQDKDTSSSCGILSLQNDSLRFDIYEYINSLNHDSSIRHDVQAALLVLHQWINASKEAFCRKLSIDVVKEYLQKQDHTSSRNAKVQKPLQIHVKNSPWLTNEEKAQQLVDQLKNLIAEKKCKEKEITTIKLKLHLAQVDDDTLPHFYDEKVQCRLHEMEQKVQDYQLQVENALRDLRKLDQPAQLHAAEQLILNQNGSGDMVSRIEQKLMRKGKWIQRDLHKDYSNLKALDGTGNVLEATNLHGERVVLKKMSLSKEYAILAAWNEVSLLLKLQGRPSIIELNGAFLHSDHGRKPTHIVHEPQPTHIVMEMPLYGMGNLMHWLKRVSSFNTEACDGRKLRSLSVDPPHDQESILRLLLGIVESVGELHNLGIEHRDLKPENILVDAQERIKLIDFGSSKNEALSFVTTLPTRTSGAYDPGTFTRYYAPPEKRNSSSNGGHRLEFGKWDVYSLGVIIYECLCSPSDWNQIETLCETQEEARRVLTQSAAFSGWIQNLVYRMLHREASSRPSIYEVAKRIKEKLMDSYSELSKRLRPMMKSAGKELVHSLHSSCKKPDADSDIYVRRFHIVEDVVSAFSQLNSRKVLLKQIRFRFKGEDESAHGSGVFREVCEALCAHLFSGTDSGQNPSQQEPDSVQDTSQDNFDSSQLQPLFVKHESHDFFSPRDNAFLPIEMRAIGRFILHCMSRNTPLRLRLSPLVYCEMTNSVPKTENGWLSIFRRLDANTTSQMDSFLNDMNNAENRQMAESMLEDKKKALYGKRYRMDNIQYLCKGLTEFMTDYEKAKLQLLNWDDMELFCCGPELISLRTLRRMMSASLRDSRWQENEQTIRTLKWFKKWLREQDNDGLRLFLRFITAQSSLPVEVSGWKLTVLPCAAGIRAQTCSKQMYIGVDRESEELFREMMQTAMENPGNLED